MIELYTGLPGSGKTLQMTERAYKNRRQYDEVVTNYGLDLGDDGPDVVRIVTAQDFVDVTMAALYQPDNRRRLILLDEVHSILDARNWAAVPPEALMVLAQPRKARLDFFYTAQHPSQVEKRLMIVTNYIWKCRGWGKDFNFRNGDHQLLFWSSCYESFEYAARGQRATVLGSRFFTVRRAAKYGARYDSMEVLERMTFDRSSESKPSPRAAAAATS